MMSGFSKMCRSRQFVQAVQLTMENRDEVAEWCGEGASAGKVLDGSDRDAKYIAVVWFKPDPSGTYVFGHDDKLVVTEGCWVVRDGAGYMSAWSDERFRAAWEEQ
jgi:hypothetical protein